MSNTTGEKRQEERAGLEGVVAAESRLSCVDGEKGELIIAGYPVEVLAANATFEQTIHLLWFGVLPDAGRLELLRSTLAGLRTCLLYTSDAADE